MSAGLQRHYKLRPSRLLTFAICLACLLVLGVVLVLPLGSLLRSFISLAIVLVCVFVLFRDAGLSLADSCVAFRLEGGDSISLMLRDGHHMVGKLGVGGVILPFVVLINVRLESGGHRALVLLKDCMDADSFRRLRVVLRWGAKQQDAVPLV